MTESNPFILSETESLKDVSDAFPEASAPIQSQVVPNAPPRCNFAETLDHPTENFNVSEFASNLQAALHGLEFLNSVTSSVPDVGSSSDSKVDITYCIGKKLKGPEAAKFLKHFRRPTSFFKFPFREYPHRRVQHNWFVFTSHIFNYSFSPSGSSDIHFLGSALSKMEFTVFLVL